MYGTIADRAHQCRRRRGVLPTISRYIPLNPGRNRAGVILIHATTTSGTTNTNNVVPPPS
jgi:hypothetical protein